MRTKIIFLCVMYVLAVTFSLSATDKPANKTQDKTAVKAPVTRMPVQIASLMDRCYSARQCDNVHNLSMLKEWFFLAPQGMTYAVYAFKFNKIEPVKKVEPENKTEKQSNEQQAAATIPLSYHLYVRIYSKTAAPPQLPQERNAPVPVQDKANDVFTFAFPSMPDKYVLIVSLASMDFTQVSTLIYDTELPSFSIADKLLAPTALFLLNDIKKLEQADTVFTVWKNYFHYGPGEIVPYFENKFQSTEQPILFMQIIGVAVDKDTSANKIEYTLVIKKDDKEVVKFKPVESTLPVFYQPIKFIKEGKNLEKGDYIMVITIKDQVADKKYETSVNLSIL